MREIDRVLRDVGLLFERRTDIDGGVGDEQRLGVSRHVHDEHVAQAPPGAQPRVGAHHLRQQLVGMQAALHQRLRVARAHQLDGARRRRMTVRRIHETIAGQVHTERRGEHRDSRHRADQHGHDDPGPGGGGRRVQRYLVAGMRDRDRHRPQRVATRNQRVVFLMRVQFGHRLPLRKDHVNGFWCGTGRSRLISVNRFR